MQSRYVYFAEYIVLKSRFISVKHLQLTSYVYKTLLASLTVSQLLRSAWPDEPCSRCPKLCILRSQANFFLFILLVVTLFCDCHFEGLTMYTWHLK